MAIGAIIEPSGGDEPCGEVPGEPGRRAAGSESGRCGSLIPGSTPSPTGLASAANCGKRRLNSGESDPICHALRGTAEAGHNGGMTVRYHLNADVGEGFPTPTRSCSRVVTQANVACGFHAGDGRRCGQVCGWRSSTACRWGPSRRTATGRASAGPTSRSGSTPGPRPLRAGGGTAGSRRATPAPRSSISSRTARSTTGSSTTPTRPGPWCDVALQFGLPLLALPGSVAHRLAEDSGGSRDHRSSSPTGPTTTDGPARAAVRSRDPSSPTPKRVGERIRQLLSRPRP